MAEHNRSHQSDPAPADDVERVSDVIEQAFAVFWTSLLGLPGFPSEGTTPERRGRGGAPGQRRSTGRRARR
jgi:hypothetical protein